MEKYERVRVLGKGSFGKAYLVRNTELDALCVVKQMETGAMNDKERKEAVKEALLLKKMDHPNIIQFQEVFMTRKGRLCIVMDYADGGDIHMEIKKREGALIPEARILDWFVQTCFAMHHVHERKVLHRDLKTQNIFLMATGQVKLGDFGIARVLEATKDYAKTMVGTPYYLSPEIIEDRPYNFKSDVWSLGVVLYECATLKHPFDAESLVVLASKILKDQYPPPDPSYSPELRALIKSMLCKVAVQRPSVHDVLSMPWLSGQVHECNRAFGLGLDLDGFAPRTPQEVVRPTSAAAGVAVAAPAVGRVEDSGDTVLMGTVTASATRTGEGETREEAPAKEREEPAKDEEYEDDFEEFVEDASGDEGREEEENVIRASVANLKLSDSTPDAGAAEDRATPVVSATGTAGRLNAKADSLRSYLQSQLTLEVFERAYRVVRACGETGGEGHTDLETRVADIIGRDKAPELFSLLQLLCFLEDVAASPQEP